MKPQPQRPNRHPNSPNSAPPETRVPVEDIDFYALRQARIVEDEDLSRRAAPVSTPTRIVEPARPKHLSPNEEKKFERLVTTTPRRGRLDPCHWGLLVATLLLTALSVPLIYSASSAIALDNHGGNPDAFLFRQAGFALFGILLMIMASRTAPAKVRGVVWTLYGVAFLGLVATKFTPLGFAMGNTERWVKLGPLTFQFSELMKIALVGVLADFWSRVSPREARKAWPWVATVGLVLVPALLTFIQPHMSATIVMLVIPFIVLFFAGASGRVLGSVLVPILVLGGITLHMCQSHSVPFLPTYQQDRIAAKFGGGDDRGNEYQALQGQRAIMRGGLLGVGLGASLYKQGHLPAPHTDFIFSVIAEETGFIGATALLGLYLAIIFFCFQIGFSTRNLFQGAFCSGVGALVGLQVVWNMMIMVGWAPVTGMPLPIITYGGSGLWCILAGLGLVLSISRAQCEEV